MSKANGLYISPTEFARFGENSGGRVPSSLSTDIATRARSPYYFYAMGMMLPNPDPILKAIGKDITVYRDMRTEASVGGNIRRRKGAVKALEWGIDKMQAKSRSAKVIVDLFADFDMNRMLSEILDATLYGYQPLEIIWGKVGPYILPVDIIGKPAEWFLFDTENQLRLRTRENPIYGETLEDRKFLLPRQDATYENPYGFPDLSMCFWPTTFKKGGLKFWVTFTEKYASPWVVGKHPRNTPVSETDELLDRLMDMVQDAVAVIPDDASVDIVESSSKGGSADIYEKLLMFCRSEVNYALLGQNQSSEASSNKASALAGLEVTHDIRDADSQLVSATFNQLIRWIWDLNFNDNACPTFSMWEQEEVDKVLAERDKTLTDAGVRFTPAYFKRAYNLRDGDIVDSIATPPPTPLATPEFAEGNDAAFPDQGALDAALAGLEGDVLQQQSAAILAPLINLIDESADYADAMGKLAALFPKLDTAKLQEALTRAMFVAELWGYAHGED